MPDPGAVFYRGPSLLTGDPIVGILTGLEGSSHNVKTGPMVQAWILRPDLPPMDAVRQNIDDAICGDCKLRGKDGHDRKCYVAPWYSPFNVWKVFTRGGYLEASWAELQALVEGRHIRLGAYGDPAAIPFEVWRMLLVTVAGFVSYTHAWRTCDPRLKTLCMASVDTVDEFHLAHLIGWRTFRVRAREEPVLSVARGTTVVPLEIICPASDEAAHLTDCQRCQLCRGTNRPARSIVIVAHGHNGAMTAFYKGRPEALEAHQSAPVMTPCAGCQKPIVARGRTPRCPDCRLEAQRQRGRLRLDAAQRKTEAAERLARIEAAPPARTVGRSPGTLATLAESG